ncbi:MAG: hypothetical protein H7A10_06200 [Oceanospirillaceae bacterium]|nr:hypothetical protein [Oceanospirillaceae bacterium]
MIFCEKPAQLADFYRHALGFEMIMQEGHKWVLESPFMALTLLPPCPGKNSGSHIKLIVPVADMQQTLDAVIEFGGTVGDIGFNTARFHAQDCLDPQGNELQLRAATKKA